MSPRRRKKDLSKLSPDQVREALRERRDKAKKYQQEAKRERDKRHKKKGPG